MHHMTQQISSRVCQKGKLTELEFVFPRQWVCLSLGGREVYWTRNLTHTHMQQLQVSSLHEYHCA